MTPTNTPRMSRERFSSMAPDKRASTTSASTSAATTNTRVRPTATVRAVPAGKSTEIPDGNCNALLSSVGVAVLADLLTALKNAQIPQKVGTAIANGVSNLCSSTNLNACAIKCTTHCTPGTQPKCPPQPPNCNPLDPTVPAPDKGTQKNPKLKPVVPPPQEHFIDFPQPYNPNDPNTKGPEPDPNQTPADLDKMRKRWSVRAQKRAANIKWNHFESTVRSSVRA